MANTGSSANGAVIQQKTVQQAGNQPGVGQIAAVVIPVFLISNISTVIFLAVYFACREKRAQKTELEKMSIQDLA